MARWCFFGDGRLSELLTILVWYFMQHNWKSVSLVLFAVLCDWIRGMRRHIQWDCHSGAHQACQPQQPILTKLLPQGPNPYSRRPEGHVSVTCSSCRFYWINISIAPSLRPGRLAREIAGKKVNDELSFSCILLVQTPFFECQVFPSLVVSASSGVMVARWCQMNN